MAEFFSCFNCHKVAPLLVNSERKCPSCGSENGEVISGDQVVEGIKNEVLQNIDPRTGKPTKKRRR